MTSNNKKSEVKFLIQGLDNYKEFRKIIQAEGFQIHKEEKPSEKNSETGRIVIQAQYPKQVDLHIRTKLAEKKKSNLLSGSVFKFNFKGYNSQYRSEKNDFINGFDF